MHVIEAFLRFWLHLVLLGYAVVLGWIVYNWLIDTFLRFAGH